MGTIVIALAVAVTAIIVAPITWFAAVTHRKNAYESKIGSAEEKSREIIDEALKTAETKKREALLEAKEESIRTKNELDKETTKSFKQGRKSGQEVRIIGTQRKWFGSS